MSRHIEEDRISTAEALRGLVDGMAGDVRSWGQGMEALEGDITGDDYPAAYDALQMLDLAIDDLPAPASEEEDEAAGYPHDINAEDRNDEAMEEWREEMRERLERFAHERPLSVEVRSGWTASPRDMEPEEFCVEMTTGGPSIGIYGDLGGDSIVIRGTWGTAGPVEHRMSDPVGLRFAEFVTAGFS